MSDETRERDARSLEMLRHWTNEAYRPQPVEPWPNAQDLGALARAVQRLEERLQEVEKSADAMCGALAEPAEQQTRIEGDHRSQGWTWISRKDGRRKFAWDGETAGSIGSVPAHAERFTITVHARGGGEATAAGPVFGAAVAVPAPESTGEQSQDAGAANPRQGEAPRPSASAPSDAAPEQPELLPCPFCGGEPYVAEPALRGDNYQIGCNCGYDEEEEDVGAIWRDGKTFEEAASRWNRRASAPQPHDEGLARDAIRAALDAAYVAGVRSVTSAPVERQYFPLETATESLLAALRSPAAPSEEMVMRIRLYIEQAGGLKFRSSDEAAQRIAALFV